MAQFLARPHTVQHSCQLPPIRPSTVHWKRIFENLKALKAAQNSFFISPSKSARGAPGLTFISLRLSEDIFGLTSDGMAGSTLPAQLTAVLPPAGQVHPKLRGWFLNRDKYSIRTEDCGQGGTTAAVTKSNLYEFLGFYTATLFLVLKIFKNHGIFSH
ncbi:hypothetical protein TYRP_016994 [Tyrophagus putrescentiae]|nr:hypothetical protein TYRP_016994 [Tyrophagus putrescentiae]